ncbi:MAG: ATP-binding cassette domain-containing protein [Prevotella sp.]|nr:ATP-binding cassette domain-containing protein [Prevotella sp.]
MISVIVTLHNNEGSIIDALQSITAQTAQKWDAVVIDNASTDGSERQVRSYLIDRRMRYVRLDREVSQEEVIRRGLAETKGEWVIFLDAKDSLDPRALEALYLAVKKYGTQIASGNYTYHSEGGGERKTALALAEGKYTGREDIPAMLIARGIIHSSQSIVSKHSTLNSQLFGEAWGTLPIAYTDHIVLAKGEEYSSQFTIHNSQFTVTSLNDQTTKRLIFNSQFSSLEHDGIRVENLNVYIGDAHILKNVTAKIPKNKITCIIGPSGCGKSTLLRTFNRIIDTTEGVKMQGDIWLGKYNITKVHGAEKIELRRHVGLVPQRPCPLPMSIYDNIAYGCRIHGIRGKEKLRQVVEHYLRSIGLWDEVKDRLKEPAARLSGGQQQRLCLARSLAVEPTVLLADESTSALDPISSKKVEQLFVDLKKDYTVVMVTHTLQQAQRVADYVVFMYLGEVIEAGPAKELFNNPQNELTRKYLDGAFS